MKSAQTLLDLNSRFYQANARSFSSTRQRLQPGVERLANRLLMDLPGGRLLDLGCGNGWLGRWLISNGFQGSYTGLEASPGLLVDARRDSPFDFIQGDLSHPGWERTLPQGPFDAVLTFAVLHHLPGMELRVQVLGKVRTLLKPGGLFCHSEWQFRHSHRLAARILPWETIGLNAADVDEGDALLDWRAEGRTGLRYLHQFSEDELTELAHAAGFKIIETFYADGREGNLGLYQVWT